MGIVNANPDSFSDPGTRTVDAVVDRALALVADGAGALDIGAQSAITGRQPADPADEAAAVVPVVRAVVAACPGRAASRSTRSSRRSPPPCSTPAPTWSTTSPGCATRPSPGSAARPGAGLAVMHTAAPPLVRRQEPGLYGEVGAEVAAFLAERIADGAGGRRRRRGDRRGPGRRLHQDAGPDRRAAAQPGAGGRPGPPGAAGVVPEGLRRRAHRPAAGRPRRRHAGSRRRPASRARTRSCGSTTWPGRSTCCGCSTSSRAPSRCRPTSPWTRRCGTNAESPERAARSRGVDRAAAGSYPASLKTGVRACVAPNAVARTERSASRGAKRPSAPGMHALTGPEGPDDDAGGGEGGRPTRRRCRRRCSGRGGRSRRPAGHPGGAGPRRARRRRRRGGDGRRRPRRRWPAPPRPRPRRGPRGAGPHGGRTASAAAGGRGSRPRPCGRRRCRRTRPSSAGRRRCRRRCRIRLAAEGSARKSMADSSTTRVDAGWLLARLDQAVTVEGDARGHLRVGDHDEGGGVEGVVDLVDRRQLLAGVAGEASAGEHLEHLAPCGQGHGDIGGGHDPPEGPEELRRAAAGDQLGRVDAEDPGVGGFEALGGVAGRQGDVGGRERAQRVEHGQGRPVRGSGRSRGRARRHPTGASGAPPDCVLRPAPSWSPARSGLPSPTTAISSEPSRT